MKTLAAIICIAFGLVSGQETRESLVLDRLLEAEARIESLQAHLSIELPERGFHESEMDWGYSLGREYLQGRRNYTKATTMEDNKIHLRVDKRTTFDGEKMYVFRRDVEATEIANVAPRGSIKALAGSNFYHLLSPNILMGFGAHEKGRLTLGQTIKQADSYSVNREMEEVQGHMCYVVRALGVERDPVVPEISYDVKVWLDAKRDMRPLRFDKCYSVEGKNRWKVINNRVDQIKLTKVNGIWLPIEGVRTYYKRTLQAPEGMAREEFKKLSLSERRIKGTWIVQRNPATTRKVTIDPNTIKVNQEIPDSSFVIEFPARTKVWDDFLEKAYTVGPDNE